MKTTIDLPDELLERTRIAAARLHTSISHWDAMILAAARTSGARELLTEDLHHGQDYDGGRIVNSFR